MFLINSRQNSVAADHQIQKVLAVDLYRELTDDVLPSSLTNFHPFTFPLSRVPTCVSFSTDFLLLTLEAFLGNLLNTLYLVKTRLRHYT